MQTKEQKEESAFHRWRREIVQKYNVFILLQAIILAFCAVLFVLVRAIYFPGYVFCQAIYCSTEPAVPDAAALTIVIVIYVHCSFWSGIICSSSGSWMDNAYYKKVAAMTTIYFMLFSFIQLVSPAVKRQEVFAYSNYSNYEIQVHQTSESNATMLVSNFWNSETLSLFQQHGYSYVTVLGYQVSQHITQPNQLLTNSKLVYKENSISEATAIALPGNFTKQILISNLENNKWYFWLISPASPAVDNTIWREYPIVTNASYTQEAIDLRGFLHCQWLSNVCQP